MADSSSCSGQKERGRLRDGIAVSKLRKTGPDNFVKVAGSCIAYGPSLCESHSVMRRVEMQQHSWVEA